MSTPHLFIYSSDTKKGGMYFQLCVLFIVSYRSVNYYEIVEKRRRYRNKCKPIWINRNRREIHQSYLPLVTDGTNIGRRESTRILCTRTIDIWYGNGTSPG